MVKTVFNPIRPGLFSCSPGLGGGGLRGPDAKSERYHQPIERKFCVSHYSHKSMLDARFESGSFSIFGDMTSRNFSLEKRTSHRIWLFIPGK